MSKIEMDQCLLCLGPHLRHVTCADGRRYFECETCAYLFLSPLQRLPPDAEKRRYLEHNNDIGDPQYLRYLQKTWSKLNPEPSPRARVLDYGCGPTRGLAEVLRETLFQVESYDPIFFADRSRVLDHHFDVIFCSEALEHAYHPRLVLDDWCRLLKPNGRVTLRTSFHPGIEKIESWWYALDPTHVGFLNSKSFAWLAPAWGFQIQHLHSPYVVLERM